MVDVVSCVASIGKACSNTDVMLHDVVNVADSGVVQQDLFKDIAQRAISQGIDIPLSGGPVVPRHADLTGGAGNAVATLKSDLVSTSARPGTEPGNSAQSPTTATEDQFSMVSSRIKALYAELTEYQTAWKVTHKVQQDITTLLKGQ
jgi:hypothetical protein